MKPPLLEKDFEKALSFGITRVLLHQRYYQSDWPLERATTEPPTPRNAPSEVSSFVDVAEQNGISRATYYLRVGKGMLPEEAATKPTAKRGRPKKRAYTDDQLAIANQHGISRQMLDRRLARGWHLERALTANHCEEWIRNHGEKAQMFVSRKQLIPKKKQGPQRYTKDQLRVALSNGIRLSTLQDRLTRGWDVERAITEPTHNTNRRKNYVEGVAYN